MGALPNVLQAKNIGYLADVPLGVCAILTTTPRRKGRGSLDRRVRVPGSSMGRGVFTQKELLAPPHSTRCTAWYLPMMTLDQ
jgi:hypothetical protein